ncbi:Vacuolar ATP synthase subunit B [Coemansia sp. 'formosensis']|nr:Vacuolar ATP synthase subunit B [Coemansia sp. 'formosensis']
MAHTAVPTTGNHPHFILDLFPGRKFKLTLNESNAATVKVDIGEEELLPEEKPSLKFLEKFEHSFTTHGVYENCTIYDLLDLGWSLLSIFLKEMLNHIL